jgi:tyrosinase
VNDIVDALEASTGSQPAHKVLGMTRRQLGVLAGLIGAGGVGLACTEATIESLIEQIQNRPVRRNANNMAADDPTLVSYAAAIEAMQALPASDPRNWTRQAQIHQSNCRHRNWLFLPWHRAYLFYFEQICRELSGDDDFALPYWNWTTERRMPAPFWDTGSPLYHEQRDIGPASQASEDQVGEDNVASALDTDNFILFAGEDVSLNHPPLFGPGMGPLESGPHNHIHNFVGGTMVSFLSPEDPIFWLHHCRVDELWVRWNVVDGNPNTNDSDWTNTEFTEFCDRNGNPVSVRVAVTTLWPLLSYRYDSQTGA